MATPSVTVAAPLSSVTVVGDQDLCSSILHDAWDTVLIVTLFIIGWWMFRPSSFLGGLLVPRARLDRAAEAEKDVVEKKQMEEEEDDYLVNRGASTADGLAASVGFAAEGGAASVDLDRVRAYGSSHRADLAVDLWVERCAKDGSVCNGEETDNRIRPALPPAPYLYGVVLECCVGCDDFESAVRLARLAAWRAPPVMPGGAGQAAFLRLAQWLARRRDVNTARQCIASVLQNCGIVDLATFKAVLASSVHSADMSQAWTIYQDLVSTGLKPDFAVYSLMVRGYCASGNVEEAMSYFQQMRRHGIMPDTLLFDGLLDCCTSRNMLSLTEQILADMADLKVSPSNTTLAILVRFHGQRGELGKSITLFKELPERHGLTANTHAYGALVAACLGAGRTDLALEAFTEMGRAGCQASARTYEALILGCIRLGDLERAVSLVDDALGLPSPAQSDCAIEAPSTLFVHRARRAILELSYVEDLLRLIGKRRQAERLGAPLVARLRAAGVDISEQVADAILRCAKIEDSTKPRPSTLEIRRAERRRWLDFQATSPLIAAAF